MLGGPVDGRLPEREVDSAARDYGRAAFDCRSKTLKESKYSFSTEVDLTTSASKQGKLTH